MLINSSSQAILILKTRPLLAPSVTGLYASYVLDLPTGAALVCTLGAALVLTIIFTFFREKRAA